MENPNKKQKLIAFIAVIVVAVILTIIITTNVVNNQMQNGEYGATANSNSNLVANVIKKGITIGGITGTLENLDTSDATATAEDILWDKTGYVKGEKITGTKVDTVALGKESQKVFDENTTLIDDYGNKVEVPAGFKIASDSATAVTGGVVIEDASAGNNYTQGSQFVWIPVGTIKTNNNGGTATITLGRYVFDDKGNPNCVQLGQNYANETELRVRSTDSFYYKELLNTTESVNTKAKNIGTFTTNTIKAGGYYFGRYEAGDATGVQRNNTTSDTNPVAIKKSLWPYNWITEAQASERAGNMYSSDSFTSDLANSYAWDTAIAFIQAVQDSDYSIQECTQRELAKCGETINSNENANDVRCNIYDMAGNTYEWTTETIYGSGDQYVNRGSGYTVVNTTQGRSSNTNGASSASRCFRVILYL